MNQLLELYNKFLNKTFISLTIVEPSIINIIATPHKGINHKGIKNISGFL